MPREAYWTRAIVQGACEGAFWATWILLVIVLFPVTLIETIIRSPWRPPQD